MKRLLLFAVLALTVSCGNNQANGQVIPGSNGITVKRCTWIADHFQDQYPFDTVNPEGLSKDFASVLAAYAQFEDYDLNRLLGALGNEEILSYWFMGIGLDEYTSKAKPSFSWVDGAGQQARILYTLQEVFQDEDDEEGYEEEDTRYLCLVKENGRWVLDDWLKSDESSMKSALRTFLQEQRGTRHIRYKGKMLEKEELGPFTVVLAIQDEEDANGENVYGAFRFDAKEEEEPYFTEVKGVKDNKGQIHFTARLEDGSQSIITGEMTADFSKITGCWLLYDADGELIADSDLTMEIWP